MSVTACPRCEGQVTLPPGATPAARAKCPLCEAEYALSEVYDKLPPMLVLLDAPVPATVGAGAAASQGAGGFEGLFLSPGDANGAGELDLAPLEGADVDFSEGGEGGAALATAPLTSKGPIRPRKKPRSMAKELVKIVLGGALGLSIGWYIALWILGKPVFGTSAERTAVEKLPDWAKPAKLRSPAPTEADSGSGNEQEPKGQEGTPGDQGQEPGTESGAEENASDGEESAAASDGETADTAELPADSGTDAEKPAAQASGDDPMSKPPGDSATDPAAPSIDPILEGPTTDPGFEIETPGLELPKPKPTTDTPGEVNPETTPPDVPPATDPGAAETPAATPAKAGLKVETPAEPAEVAQSLEAAKETTAVLSPEDEAAKSAFTKEKFAAYTTLCEAALGVAHVPSGDADSKAAASALAASVTANDADATVMGQLANAWLSRKRANDGIVLVGTVKAADTQGDLTTINIELPALEGRLKELPVTVVCPVDTSLQTGDQITVVGKVVEKAKDEIEGYTGENGRAVWGATVTKRLR